MSSSPVLSAEHRAWQYWFDDGLPTLVAGIGCLLGALAFAYDHSQDATPRTIAVSFAALLLYSSVLLFQRSIIGWLKSRITYPRTGYAQPSYFEQETAQPLDILTMSKKAILGESSEDTKNLRQFRKQQFWLTSAFIALAVAAIVFFPNRSNCALAGVILAIALGIWGRKVWRLSWIVLGGFPFMGFFLGFALRDHIPSIDRVIYFLAGAGVIFVLDGTISLLRYLHANPHPTQTQP